MSNVDPQASKENTLTASELKKILLDHKDWLKTAGRDGKSANLKHCHLKGVVLLGADLSNADLEGAYLYGAILYGAKLTSSDFTGVTLCFAGSRPRKSPIMYLLHVFSPMVHLQEVRSR